MVVSRSADVGEKCQDLRLLGKTNLDTAPFFQSCNVAGIYEKLLKLSQKLCIPICV